MVQCMIYYYSTRTRKQVIHELSTLVALPVENEQYAYTLKNDDCYIGIQINEEAANELAPVDKGDYRSFPYFIDITSDLLEAADALPMVKKILEYFWSLNIAAVAECGFETELPFSGGSEKEDMPWPITGIAINYEES